VHWDASCFVAVERISSEPPVKERRTSIRREGGKGGKGRRTALATVDHTSEAKTSVLDEFEASSHVPVRGGEASSESAGANRVGVAALVCESEERGTEVRKTRREICSGEARGERSAQFQSELTALVGVAEGADEVVEGTAEVVVEAVLVVL
jgi:hypothetical protein